MAFPVFSYEYDMKQTNACGSGIHLTDNQEILHHFYEAKVNLYLLQIMLTWKMKTRMDLMIMLEIQNDDVSGIDTQKLAGKD